jgi:hypothetical protein
MIKGRGVVKDILKIQAHLDYMSYSLACDMFAVEKQTFEERRAYLNSFEYWAKSNWWNPGWEHLRDECEEEE